MDGSGPGRRPRALVVLIVAAVASIATSPATYEPDITAEHSEHITLTADQPFATGTVLLQVSEGLVDYVATREEAIAEIGFSIDAGEDETIVVPQLRLTTSLISDAGTETAGREDATWPLAEVCAALGPCERPFEVAIEWVNPQPNGSIEAFLTAVAGVALRPDDEGMSVGTMSWTSVEPLQLADAEPSVQSQTEPETVVLSADAPFASRHVTVEMSAEALSPESRSDDRHVVFVASQSEFVEVGVRLDPGVAGSGGLGTFIELQCESSQPCTRGYTIVMQWLARDRSASAEITWQAAAVLRYPDSEQAPAGATITTEVDRQIDVVRDGSSLTANLNGSVTRDVGDTSGPPPFENARPELSSFAVGISPSWDAAREFGLPVVPAVGTIRLDARGEDAPADGFVDVTIGLPERSVQFGPPERLGVGVNGPSEEFAVVFTRACSEAPCRVPVEIYIHPLPETFTQPVTVDWSVDVVLIAPPGVEIDDESLSLEPGPFEPATDR